MKSATLSDYAKRILQIDGGLFFISGISLLWRGGVGILFIFHEQFSIAFLAIFLLHTIIGGAIYTYFGFCLLREKNWTRALAGWIIAFSAFLWAIPSFGADYFTVVAGGVFFIGFLLFRHSESRSPGGPPEG